MTKFLKQDVIEETGLDIFRNSLDKRFFIIHDHGKDKYPDIDGHIRLRDGASHYFNLYLHYQLKSTVNLVNKKFPVNKEIINYSLTTNVPTLLFVVDVKVKKVYWYFFDKKYQKLVDQKKGITIDLSNHEIENNSFELNQLWQKYSIRSDFNEQNETLQVIGQTYQNSLENCLAVLFIFGKIQKNQMSNIFCGILKLQPQRVESIIMDLLESRIIVSTMNYYLLTNEEIGIKSLIEFLNGFSVDSLESIFEDKKEVKILYKQLARVNHPVAKQFFEKSAKELLLFLQNPSTNDDIFQKLETLEEYILQVSKITCKIIEHIVNNQSPLPPTQKEFEGFGIIVGKTHDDLLLKCIELAEIIRYYEPKFVFDMLLGFSNYSIKNISERAIKGLKEISKFNFFVLRNIKYQPQEFLLKEIEKLSTKKLKIYLLPILVIAKEILQAGYQGHSLDDYETVNFHEGSLHASENLMDIRNRAILILQKLYWAFKDNPSKIMIMEILKESSYTNFGGYDDQLSSLVLENISTIIDFYISITPTADFNIVKEIEEQVNWFIRRHSKEKLKRIEELESLISTKSDFDMFKIFVGYDNHFDEGLGWEKSEELRRTKINEFVTEMTNENFEVWQKKIVAVTNNYYDQVHGEFQYFNRFLEQLGKVKPEIAIKLLEAHESKLNPFLLYLVGGICQSHHPNLGFNLINKWIEIDKNLSMSANIFYFISDINQSMLRRIFERAKKYKDIETLNNIIQAIISNFEKHKNTKSLFIEVIKELTFLKNHQWINLWFKKDYLIDSTSKREVNIILENLLLVPRIDYHTEEVLTSIAEREPLSIISYFEKRINLEKNKEKSDHYKAVPYDFHKLHQTLCKHASVIIPVIFEWFNKKYWLFSHEAGDLLYLIFPTFDPLLELELQKLLQTGRKKDAQIILRILRSYEGQSSSHSICRKFIKKYGSDKNYARELHSILSKTGVVSGEYGFLEAYKQKKAAIQSWKEDTNPAIQSFISGYEEYLDRNIEHENLRAHENTELFKRRYH